MMTERIDELFADGAVVQRHRVTTAYDWQADPPTVTITVTDDADGSVISTTTEPVPDREIAHQHIVTTWGQRRAELVAAYGALGAVAPQIVAANTALQAATATGDVVAAVKAYASANLTALGALKDAQEGVMGALGVMEEAVIWLDEALADMREDAE